MGRVALRISSPCPQGAARGTRRRQTVAKAAPQKLQRPCSQFDAVVALLFWSWQSGWTGTETTYKDLAVAVFLSRARPGLLSCSVSHAPPQHRISWPPQHRTSCLAFAIRLRLEGPQSIPSLPVSDAPVLPSLLQSPSTPATPAPTASSPSRGSTATVPRTSTSARASSTARAPATTSRAPFTCPPRATSTPAMAAARTPTATTASSKHSVFIDDMFP